MKRKMSSCFYFNHSRKMDSRYLCSNLCSSKWLRPSCDLISYLVHLGLCRLNRLLGDGLTNGSEELELRISISNLFHLGITEITKSETTFNSRLSTDY